MVKTRIHGNVMKNYKLGYKCDNSQLSQFSKYVDGLLINIFHIHRGLP